MTPEGARLVAQRRTREFLARKAKEANVTHEVVICLKVTATVRVEAKDKNEAEELAHELVTEMLPPAFSEDDRAVHQVRAIPAEPVRTVALPRDIGDGVIADDWADA
jgi:hypothetical protein